jgi:hypothetical protein
MEPPTEPRSEPRRPPAQSCLRRPADPVRRSRSRWRGKSMSTLKVRASRPISSLLVTLMLARS